MPNRFKRKYYGTWNVFSKSYTRAELEGRRRQLAKVANSRILSLERAKSSLTGERLYDQSQFDTVQNYISTNTKSGRRFSESKNYKGSDFDLKREIYVLEQFLEMQSSTVGGNRRRERRILRAFEEKNLPSSVIHDENFWRFLNSETYQNLVSESADSEDILDIFDRASDDGLSPEEIVDRFNKWKGTTVKSLFKAFGLKPF